MSKNFLISTKSRNLVIIFFAFFIVLLMLSNISLARPIQEKTNLNSSFFKNIEIQNILKKHKNTLSTQDAWGLGILISILIFITFPISYVVGLLFCILYGAYMSIIDSDFLVFIGFLMLSPVWPVLLFMRIISRP